MYELSYLILGIILVLSIQDHIRNRRVSKEILELKKKIEDILNNQYK